MTKQRWYMSHGETIAQNVVGQILAYIVLRCFGIEGPMQWQLQGTMFVVAYTRGYIIRRLFNRLKG